MFSRIVPSITPQNIGSLAPLTVIGLLYGIAGAAMAWIIRLLFWVPHRFRYGILGRHTYVYPCHLSFQSRVISLLATAIAMGITASAPFNGVEDENLAIAYVSALILIFLVRFLSPKLAVFVELATGI
jgi:auxin efflux carrier family protein